MNQDRDLLLLATVAFFELRSLSEGGGEGGLLPPPLQSGCSL